MNNGEKIFFSIISFFGLLCISALLFIAFMATSEIAGYSHREYRCTDGVVEERDVHWGVGMFSYQPIDGDPAGACH